MVFWGMSSWCICNKLEIYTFNIRNWILHLQKAQYHHCKTCPSSSLPWDQLMPQSCFDKLFQVHNLYYDLCLFLSQTRNLSFRDWLTWLLEFTVKFWISDRYLDESMKDPTGQLMIFFQSQVRPFLRWQGSIMEEATWATDSPGA